MTVHLAPGAATGVGSLPHTDASAAADFVLERLPDLPAIPSLPRRSRAEAMLAQAVVGVAGVTIERDGTVGVDPCRMNPDTAIVTDLEHDAYGGLRAFLAAAVGRRGPVKWQITGPVTLGLSFVRRGVAPDVAFGVSVRAVRAHLSAIQAAVRAALPGCGQVVVIDEPGMTGLTQPGFPVAPDAAIDVLSSALAAVDPTAMAGVHCCGAGDWAAIMASGPTVLSLPAVPALTAVAGSLADYLDAGGWVVWGAVPTDRPVGDGVERCWRELAAVWCSLVQLGCDPARLRNQALVSPACGLGLHDVTAAAHVLDIVDAVADRVHGQAVATRLSIGA